MVIFNLIVISLMVYGIVIGLKEIDERDNPVDTVGIGAFVILCFITLFLAIVCEFKMLFG